MLLRTGVSGEGDVPQGGGWRRRPLAQAPPGEEGGLPRTGRGMAEGGVEVGHEEGGFLEAMGCGLNPCCMRRAARHRAEFRPPLQQNKDQCLTLVQPAVVLGEVPIFFGGGMQASAILFPILCQVLVTVQRGSPPPPPGSTARATAPSPGRPTPGVVKQDKSSGGSVDTTKTRSGPQRVGMCRGERPIGAAKGTQSDTEALCHPPPPAELASCQNPPQPCPGTVLRNNYPLLLPPMSNECLAQRTLPCGPSFFGTQLMRDRV